MQIYKVFIFSISADIFLDVGSLFINDTQCTLIHCRCAEQNLIYKTHFLLCGKFTDSALNEMLQDRSLLGTYGNDTFLCQKDTKRDSCIVFGFMTDLCCRNIHQDQGISILQLNTGTFFLIQCGTDVCHIDIILFRDFLTLLHCWVCHHDPDSRIHLFYFMKDTVVRLVHGHHMCHTCLSDIFKICLQILLRTEHLQS